MNSFVESAHDEILKHFNIFGVNYFGLDVEREHLALAIDLDLYCAAAYGSGKFSLLEVSLKRGDLILHLLCLLEHLVHISCGAFAHTLW